MALKYSKFLHAHMAVAGIYSQLSHAIKRKVGSIIVKDGRIISIGYNGTVTGTDNTCEDVVDGELITRPTVFHAEANAILKLAKSHDSSEGATLFVTLSPCLDCAKLIHQAGISSVYYKESYKGDKGVEFLKSIGVTVSKLDTE